jgi:hypothetical protein
MLQHPIIRKRRSAQQRAGQRNPVASAATGFGTVHARQHQHRANFLSKLYTSTLSLASTALVLHPYRASRPGEAVPTVPPIQSGTVSGSLLPDLSRIYRPFPTGEEERKRRAQNGTLSILCESTINHPSCLTRWRRAMRSFITRSSATRELGSPKASCRWR